MKTTIKPVATALIAAFVFLSGCTKEKHASWKSFQNPLVAAQIKSFVTEKEAQASAASIADGQAMPSEFKGYFAAAAQGDWPAVNRDFQNYRNHAPQYEHSGKNDLSLRGPAWQAVVEVWGALDSMAEGNEKYSTLYASEIINSIPPGSVYFGGTDPGRFLITGMEKSQIHGDPFFLITQNALADSTYLDYVRSMYGSQLYIPTSDDSQKCFQDYTEDAKKRAQNNQLKPGENIQVDPQSGKVSVSGEIAVMEINGLLAKVIFDQNSNYDFYIEQSFPLDWMYPYLEPHGMILKLDRQPVTELSEALVQQDHDYWSKLIQPMIGDWLNDDSSVQDVADFAKKVFQENDLAAFTGDPQFIQSDYSYKMFSKERASIADLYVWRMNHAVESNEKERMARAANFAFLQAWALCPSSPEVVFRYVTMLMSEKKSADALLVAETAAQMPEMKGNEGAQLRALVNQLSRNQNAQ
jgi:hypothetical protein